MATQGNRRDFFQKCKWGLFSAWAAGVGGLNSLLAAPVKRPRKIPIRSLSLTGFIFRPGTKRKPETCEEDIVICIEQDIVIKCTNACDGCNACNSNCDACNGCNVCDHGCDPGCNTCNACNACNHCDMCNATCNTCNQCDYAGDFCVQSCDNACDGCHGSNTCTVDIDKDGKSDREEVKALENSIRAMERTLDWRRSALAKLRRS